jgi:chemotaxis protein MotB
MDRFHSITGKADTEPLYPDNPYLPANRRIAITLMSEAPPVPSEMAP